MCGICGEIRLDRNPASSRTVEAMAEVLAPRGPDSAGAFAQGSVAFGHRRLKIIDLVRCTRSSRWSIPHLGLSIVFNGCIYNYRELRAELEGMGYRFFSDGDTEVILKAYHAWGSACVERLYGMFAFAIWERDSGRVCAGARPARHQAAVSRARRQARLRFASTLPALLAGGGVDTAIDPIGAASLHDLPRGGAGAADDPERRAQAAARDAADASSRMDRARERVYWDRPLRAARRRCASLVEVDGASACSQALRRAVERRMVADVPVGVLLSGGLDSSLIVGLLAEAGQTGLQTFSIGFEAVGRRGGRRIPLFRPDRAALRHRPPQDLRRLAAGRCWQRCRTAIARDGRADGQPRRVGFYLLSQEVREARQGGAERAGRRRDLRRLSLVSAADARASDAGRPTTPASSSTATTTTLAQVLRPRTGMREDYSRDFVRATSHARRATGRSTRRCASTPPSCWSTTRSSGSTT